MRGLRGLRWEDEIEGRAFDLAVTMVKVILTS